MTFVELFVVQEVEQHLPDGEEPILHCQGIAMDVSWWGSLGIFG